MVSFSLTDDKNEDDRAWSLGPVDALGPWLRGHLTFSSCDGTLQGEANAKHSSAGCGAPTDRGRYHRPHLPATDRRDRGNAALYKPHGEIASQGPAGEELNRGGSLED